MGCTATVNLRDVEKVDRIMPQEFHDWLGEQGTASWREVGADIEANSTDGEEG
jgi:hypothetical protein